MTHDELARHLAAHLRSGTGRMVWTDMPMGSAGSVRPDVYALAKSFTIDATAYEVKVSRADFLADANAGKWRGYLAYAARVYFAAPKGLLKAAEIPPGAGLIVLDGDTWGYSRRAKPQPQPVLPQAVWMKLLLDGIEREVDARTRTADRKSHFVARQEALARVGTRVAQAWRDVDAAVANEQAEQARLAALMASCKAAQAHARAWHAEELQQLRGQFDAAGAALVAASGLPPETDVALALRTMRALAAPVASQRHEAAQQLRAAMRDLERRARALEGDA
jgi:hypothetical protein